MGRERASSRSTTRRSRVALLSAAALVLAGCGAETTDAAGENTGQTCEDLDAYADALRNLAGTLGPDATPEEVQAARDDAAEAQRTLHDSISEVAQDRTDEFNAAWDALMTAFDDVDDGAPLSESVASLRAQAQEVLDSTGSIDQDLDC